MRTGKYSGMVMLNKEQSVGKEKLKYTQLRLSFMSVPKILMCGPGTIAAQTNSCQGGGGHTLTCGDGNVAGETGDVSCSAGGSAASTQNWACTDYGTVASGPDPDPYNACWNSTTPLATNSCCKGNAAT